MSEKVESGTMEGLKAEWRRRGAMLANRSPEEQSAFLRGFYHEKLKIRMDDLIKNASIKGCSITKVYFDEFPEDMLTEDVEGER